MSEQPADDSQKGGAEQPRDNQGRFTTKSQSDSSEQSQPTSSDYTKMNSFLAKQLGLTDKLADFQTKYEPEALFRQLSFMAENTEGKGGTTQKTLPENQNIVPISPQPTKHELPGVQMHKPILTKDKFSVSFKMNPKDLIQPKDKK